ncbi:MAG: succinyl-CoA--3-ketoacid-CoA transferase, partial [Myxococcales bacterium]|nr:succinyl-CoA--3-ketoacid-CoA transferase [Myxococcales bacterium]
THQSKAGESKLVTECSFPLTARGVVTRVITDLAVLDPAGEGFRLVELAPGVSREELEDATDAPILDVAV